MIRRLSQLIARNRAGSGEAVPSVCTTQPAAQQAVRALYARIDEGEWPEYLLRDVFAPSVLDRARGLRGAAGGLSRSLVFASIQGVLLPYFRTRS